MPRRSEVAAPFRYTQFLDYFFNTNRKFMPRNAAGGAKTLVWHLILPPPMTTRTQKNPLLSSPRCLFATKPGWAAKIPDCFTGLDMPGDYARGQDVSDLNQVSVTPTCAQCANRQARVLSQPYSAAGASTSVTLASLTTSDSAFWRRMLPMTPLKALRSFWMVFITCSGFMPCC